MPRKKVEKKYICPDCGIDLESLRIPGRSMGNRKRCDACSRIHGKQREKEYDKLRPPDKEGQKRRWQKWYSKPESKLKANEYAKKYRRESEKYREYRRKYMCEYFRSYRKTEKNKIIQRKAQSKHRRNLAFNPLNNFFENSVAHHIDDKNVVFIPEKIHLRFCGHNVKLHREKVLDFFGSVENMVINRPILENSN